MTPGASLEDLKHLIIEAYDHGDEVLTLSYLCFFFGWILVPAEPAKDAIDTHLIDRDSYDN